MTMIQTPELDEINIEKWFHTKYNPAHQAEIRNLLENYIWITAKKIKIPVRKMSTDHIKNCIKCWNGNGGIKIPNGYLGGKSKWIKIFTDELINRQ